jgi:hypothetical protein
MGGSSIWGGTAAALPEILRKIKLNIQIIFSVGDTNTLEKYVNEIILN